MQIQILALDGAFKIVCMMKNRLRMTVLKCAYIMWLENLFFLELIF